MMTAVVAKLLWVAGVVAWGAIRYPFQRRAWRLGVARSTGGIGDRIALGAAAVGLFLVPAIYAASGQPAFADYPFRPVLGWLGLVVLVAGLVLFRVTHKQLGRNWSITLETRATHKLITGGLYHYVRHPMYFSFLVWAAAQALLLPNFVGGLAGLAGLAILVGYRIGREERLMIETFGEEYRAYMRRTARILPWVF